jgi:hypothetical protein
LKFLKKYIGLLVFSVLFLLFSTFIYRVYFFEKQEVDINQVKVAVSDKILAEINYSESIINNLKEKITGVNKLSFSFLKIPSKYSYYIFKNKNLLFWSDNKFMPTYEIISGYYNSKYFYFKSGKFLVTKEILYHNSI